VRDICVSLFSQTSLVNSKTTGLRLGTPGSRSRSSRSPFRKVYETGYRYPLFWEQLCISCYWYKWLVIESHVVPIDIRMNVTMKSLTIKVHYKKQQSSLENKPQYHSIPRTINIHDNGTQKTGWKKNSPSQRDRWSWAQRCARPDRGPEGKYLATTLGYFNGIKMNQITTKDGGFKHQTWGFLLQ
jgi:hypothetical protein